MLTLLSFSFDLSFDLSFDFIVDFIVDLVYQCCVFYVLSVFAMFSVVSLVF